MLASRAMCLVGLEAIEVSNEVRVSSSGESKTTIVGVPDSVVRESRERVRAAILSSGCTYPKTTVLINLAPASLPKSGSAFASRSSS